MNSSSENGLREFLQGVFGCSADVATRIGQRAVDRRFAVKAIILKQGYSAGATFLLVVGRAHALTYGLEGQLVLLHEYEPGDFFGAITHTAPEPEQGDVVAIDDVRVAMFLALDFLSLIETHGCVGLAVSRMLLRQLRAAADRMVERTTLSAAGRVYVELLRLAQMGGGRTVQPAPVLAALAVRVNSTRETVSRTINALERRGIIRREADALVIVAPHRLEEMIA